ncbi:MAG: dTMP kinase [Firmicutes bacterium]|jgi:dTMP kinase|nr:dTMP kinase [Bacillota bacterium]
MKKGIFISVEGSDGSGKSTQIENIKKFFKDKGIDIVFTREPGGTQIGEILRNLVLDKNLKEMDDMTEALVYAAARAQHVAQVIKPALNEGKIVICDRFVDSSIAYQGYGRGLGESVKIINDFAIAGCMPDVTFLMKMDPRIGRRRIKADQQDRIELEKDDFHIKTFEGYLELERQYPDRIVGIDASRTIEEIKIDIYNKLEDVLKSVVE